MSKNLSLRDLAEEALTWIEGGGGRADSLCAGLRAALANTAVGGEPQTVLLKFEGVGAAGPFPVTDGREVIVPRITVADLIRWAAGKSHIAQYWSARALEGYSGVTVWIGDRQVTRIAPRTVIDTAGIDALRIEFETARGILENDK